MLSSLLVALVTVGSALGDPARFFEQAAFRPDKPDFYPAKKSFYEQPTGGLQQVSRLAQEQAVLVIESVLGKSSEESQCLAKAACLYGAADANREQNDLVTGFSNLELILRRAQELQARARQGVTNSQRLLRAIEVGRSLNGEHCESLFVCDQSYFQRQQGRVTCDAAGMLCPAFSIGCAMCGLIGPPSCGSACTVAGLYCGFGGYACAAQAQKEAENEPTTMAPPATTMAPNPTTMIG